MTGYSEVVTESSLRASISVGIRQLAKAIDKQGTTALTGATASTLQSACKQVETWLKNGATTYDGRVISVCWFRHLLAEELDALRYQIGEQAYWAGNYPEAGRIFNDLATQVVN